jgi:hypothetical protein
MLAQQAAPGAATPDAPPIDWTTRISDVDRAAARVTWAFVDQGSEGAARALRELTESASPDFAARLLRAVQPTIEHIAADPGQRSAGDTRLAPAEHRYRMLGASWKAEQVVADLSAACSRASEDTANLPIVGEVAASLAQFIDNDPERLDRFEYKFGSAVARGDGAELGLEVVARLKEVGRTKQADYILGDITSGVERLHHRMNLASNAYVEARHEQLYLAANYGSWALDSGDATQSEALRQFWSNYEKQHPALARTQAALDKVAREVVRTVGTLAEHEKDVTGLPFAPNLQAAGAELINEQVSGRPSRCALDEAVQGGGDCPFAGGWRLKAALGPTLLEFHFRPRMLVRAGDRAATRIGLAVLGWLIEALPRLLLAIRCFDRRADPRLTDSVALALLNGTPFCRAALIQRHLRAAGAVR